MYAASFSYVRPRSLSEAIAQVTNAGDDAKLIAGGQSLVPLLRLRLARPALIVDIGRLEALRYIRVEVAELRLGALTTESELAAAAAAGPSCAALTDAAAVIADPLVRNRGTVGGNVVHADPANDLPAVMTALAATAIVESTQGTREEPVAGMFLGPMATTLAAGDIISGFRVPVVPDAGSAYVKVERQAGDYAIVAAAVWVRVEGPKVTGARIVLTNAGPVPIECTTAAAALLNVGSWETVRGEAAASAAGAAEFAEDLRGGVAYKQAVARRVVSRALDQARERAKAAA